MEAKFVVIAGTLASGRDTLAEMLCKRGAGDAEFVRVDLPVDPAQAQHLNQVRAEGKIPVAVTDYAGLQSVKKMLGRHEVFGVYLAPDDWGRVRARMQEEGTLSSDEIDREIDRLEGEIHESYNSPAFVNSWLVNADGQLEETFQALRQGLKNYSAPKNLAA